LRNEAWHDSFLGSGFKSMNLKSWQASRLRGSKMTKWLLAVIFSSSSAFGLGGRE
jgi:hypothetical protein